MCVCVGVVGKEGPTELASNVFSYIYWVFINLVFSTFMVGMEMREFFF